MESRYKVCIVSLVSLLNRCAESSERDNKYRAVRKILNQHEFLGLQQEKYRGQTGFSHALMIPSANS